MRKTIHRPLLTDTKKATIIKRHWELWLKEKRTGIDLSAKRRKIQADIRDSDPDNPMEKQAVTLLNEAQKHLRKVKLKAKELRDEFLLERAEM